LDWSDSYCINNRRFNKRGKFKFLGIGESDEVRKDIRFTVIIDNTTGGAKKRLDEFTSYKVLKND